jgi:hypothetical protein
MYCLLINIYGGYLMNFLKKTLISTLAMACMTPPALATMPEEKPAQQENTTNESQPRENSDEREIFLFGALALLTLFAVKAVLKKKTTEESKNKNAADVNVNDANNPSQD